MNPHSAAVAGSGNPLKSRFESEIRAKIFAKSADPFAYSPPSRNETKVSHERDWFLYFRNVSFFPLKISRQIMEQNSSSGLHLDELSVFNRDNPFRPTKRLNYKFGH